MTKFLRLSRLSILAAAFSTSTATWAADIPSTYSPVPPQPQGVYRTTQFTPETATRLSRNYPRLAIFAGLGYMHLGSKITLSDIENSGYIGGLSAEYNFLFGPILVGVGADANISNIKRSGLYEPTEQAAIKDISVGINASAAAFLQLGLQLSNFTFGVQGGLVTSRLELNIAPNSSSSLTETIPSYLLGVRAGVFARYNITQNLDLGLIYKCDYHVNVLSGTQDMNISSTKPLVTHGGFIELGYRF